MRNRFETALQIQNACNFTAVVNELQKMIQEIPHHERITDPAVLLLVNKLADLTGQAALWPSEAERECKLRA